MSKATEDLANFASEQLPTDQQKEIITLTRSLPRSRRCARMQLEVFQQLILPELAPRK